MKMNNTIAAAAILAGAFVLAGCDNKPAPQEQAKSPPQQVEPPKPKPVPLLEQPVGSLVGQNTPRGTELLKKYGDRIHYENEAAKVAVETFNIDCLERDHRYVPLVNVLALKISFGAEGNYDQRFTVKNIDLETRIISEDKFSSGIEFEINKWGEMRYRGPGYLRAVLCMADTPDEALYVIPK